MVADATSCLEVLWAGQLLWDPGFLIALLHNVLS